MYEKVPVTLTNNQVRRMNSGHPVQLASHQIAGSGVHKNFLMLHPVNAKKVAGAIRKSKGCRIHVSPHEFEASGEGLKEFLQGLKNAGKWVKQNIIDTPFYQQSIKPIVRQAVDTGFSAVAPKLGVAAPAAKSGVDKLGEVTGAYGLKKKRAPRAKKVSKKVESMPRPQYYAPFELAQNMAPLIGAYHPAMWPVQPYLPDIGGRIRRNRDYGGSFRAV